MWGIIVLLCSFSVYCGWAAEPTVCETFHVPRFVNYHLTSWEQEVGGTGMINVENSAAGIATLALTGNEQVTIVVHGRESGIYTEFGNTFKYSLITADKQMIVILVDWSFLSFPPYEQAVRLVPCIAHELQTFIENMVIWGPLDRTRLHLIGFDLGAHIVGIASRGRDSRPRKITALDPAGDLWDATSIRLRPTDAQFVEVIHTNGNGTLGTALFGTGEPLGTLDFFANGGVRQPGCGMFDNACHHNRAWRLFAGTVDTGGHLVGLRCQNLEEVLNDRCFAGPVAVMGTLEIFKLWTGIYRINTGSIYPY